MSVLSEVVDVTTPRREIFARHVQGRYHTVRSSISFLLQALLFLGPWLMMNGRQAILIDVPGRKLHVFAWTFWPQETYFMLLILVFMGVTLFAVTAVGGRMWCGYACPQSLFTQSFMMVERLLEGDRARRLRLVKAPWTAAKAMRRLAKYGLWVTMALWLGLTVTGYFNPIRELVVNFATGEATRGQLAMIAFFAAAAFVDFGFFREQFCFYVCPYGRFQSAMLDQDTLIVAYDKNRGEPRGKAGKAAGACVDCSLCQQVCPMGIDIRNGLQLECINCTACIDACDSVMDKLHQPRGLIGYSSLNKLEGKPWRLVRPRLFIYAAVLSSIAALFTFLLVNRPPVSLDVVRGQTPFGRSADGRISNTYDVKLVNKTATARQVYLEVEGFPGAELVAPSNPVGMAGESVQDMKVLVLHSPDKLPPVSRLRIKAYDPQDPSVRAERPTSFLGPGL